MSEEETNPTEPQAEVTPVEPVVTEVLEGVEGEQTLEDLKPIVGEQANGYWWGTGRRKSSVARVRIREGTGTFVVNQKEMTVFFCNEQDRQVVLAPLQTTETVGKYDIFVTTHGGGMTGQAGAIRMGLARALLVSDSGMEPALREADHLTRDSRAKERKKYGRAGARRSFQFSKR